MDLDHIILIISAINMFGTLFLAALVLDMYGDIQELRKERRYSSWQDFHKR